MVQPLVITKQEPIANKLKLHFTINKPGVFEYVPEYCAYSLDNGTTWYKAVEVRQNGHCDDPLFVPQGGQGFIYVFNGPSADDLDAAGTLYPQVISRLTLIERDCAGAPPGTPDYMDPSDPTTGGVPPFPGQPPVTGQPPRTGDNPPSRDPRDPQPPKEGGGPNSGGDVVPGNPDAPSPGTPGDTEPDGPDTLPPGGPTYPGYPGGPDEHDDPPTPVPNEPEPPVTNPDPVPGGPAGEVPGGRAPYDPPAPGDDVPTSPGDQGPTGGVTDPRPVPPGDGPTAPPGGFDPATPPPVDDGGEGGPEIPQPGPTEPPTLPPSPTGLPPPPPLLPPGTPGADDLPAPSPIPVPPIGPIPVPPGGGGVTLPPELPDSQPLDGGAIPLPPDFNDPHAPKVDDGNVGGLAIDHTVVSGAARGVPSAGGTDASFWHEASTSAWTPTQAPDMGEPGIPLLMVPPGNYLGNELEVYAMPKYIYNDTSAVVVTARVVNVSHPSTLADAALILEFIAPDGRVVWLGESTRFNLPNDTYYSISKAIPAHALWPTGVAHVHAILMVNGQPLGDAMNELHLMSTPEAVY